MPYSPAHWRLILSPLADGPTNMAVDEAILLAIAEGRAPPTLRFFRWAPPCLSLGYAQPIEDADLERLHGLGWGLVRRPTGGRAILHTDELTYSVIAPMTEPRVSGGVVESYRQLSAGLLRGLEILGLNVHADKEYSPTHPHTSKILRAQQAGHTLNPVCFEVPSNYEITAGDKKLLGSAQVRKRGVVLQHGTLPLTGDIARICEVLRFDSEAERQVGRARVRQRATTAGEVLGRAISWQEATTAMTQGFAEALNLTLEESALTPNEMELSDQLWREKYAAEGWNFRL
jgi:lipoate-protein ligase A